MKDGVAYLRWIQEILSHPTFRLGADWTLSGLIYWILDVDSHGSADQRQDLKDKRRILFFHFLHSIFDRGQTLFVSDFLPHS
ncbi:hypothetical protein TRIP_B200155 [uncultured Desulfatiglans sp.]|nr:hypothetical protein TRIP_B200155 [uncultured Desulfatiglans sp.]